MMSSITEGYGYSRPISEIVREEKWSTVRAIRDANLKATDWIVLKYQEIGESIPQNVAEYRQALRDIPNVYDNPDDVVWPTKPE